MIRRTIRELVVLYRLEPELRDVFVEGVFDRQIIQWVLSKCGLPEAKVLTIASVDVPPELLSTLQLTEGNKQRVLALAVAVNKALGDDALQLTCIADADEDRVLESMIEVSQLLWTDFVSLDSYLIDEDHVTKFMHLALGCRDVEVPELLEAYGNVLREVFLIRAAARKCNLPVRMLSFVDCCNRDGGALRIDQAKLLRRLLDASQLRAHESQLSTAIEELRSKLSHDKRDYMNGEDFIQLLRWDQRDATRRKELRSLEAVRAALVACVDYEAVSVLPMFRSLLSRVS